LTITIEVATALAEALCQRIGESRFNLWFAGKSKFLWDGEQLRVGVANLLMQDWLQKTFGAEVRAAAAEVLGQAVPVKFVIDPQLFQASRQQQAEAVTAPKSAVKEPTAPKIKESLKRAPTRRWRRLEDFVVGACNRVAHASAQSLVETPEESPIPLVLHGPVGVGKTHLLEGICAGWHQSCSDWRILFVTAEEFTNRFVQAMHLHKLNAFRKQFRDCDALLLDDLHFLAKKQATQEEFLHTLDALQMEQRPVVLTTDCHPRLADHFLPELTDRLVGGAVWGLTPPDHATRLELLRVKSAKAGILADHVLDYLAEHLRGNVRELEGAVHTLQHLSKVTQRKIDVELVSEALGDLLRHSVRLVRLEDVERVVCEVLAVSRELLFSRKRSWIYSYPRMLAMYLARKHTNATYGEVGKHFGGRNHSTVVAGEKKARQWMQDNITLQLGKRIMPVRDIVERIERLLGE
jgi:chromosomal replication initiator protein